MKLMRALLCAAVLGAFSVPAVASPPKAKQATPTKVRKAKKPKKAKKATTKLADKRVKNYDFLGDELQGDIAMPDGADVQGRVGARFGNLIKYRLSFLHEITKAGENM